MKRLLLELLLVGCLGTLVGGPVLAAGEASPPDAPGGSAQASTTGLAPVSNEAEDQYLFATELFGKKMYELAVQQYEKFLAAYPRHPKAFQARLRVGEALFRLNRFDQSVAAYEKALALRPETKFRAEALVGMGLALFNEKNYVKAVATLREAQGLTTGDSSLGPVAANWLGEALFASENYAEAIKAYQAVSQWPDSEQAPQAMYSVGFCQLKLNQPDQAAETFRRVSEKYGDSPVAAESALRAGEVLLGEKQYKTAAQQYEFILSKYPHTEYAGDAQAGLAWTRFAEADFEGARAAFQEVLARYPQSKAAAEAPLRIGDCYYSQKKYAEAAGTYAQAAKSPDAGIASEATYWLGMSRLALKSPTEATTAFESLATKFPKSPFAQRGEVRLAEALTEEGKTDAALSAYGRAIALSPASSAAETAAYARGVLLYSAKRVPEAASAFKQFVAQYPKSGQIADARLALAQCEFETKEFKPAVNALQPLTAPGAAKGDTLAAAWFLIGQCQARLKATDAAVAAFKASVDAAPDGPYAPRALANLGSLYTATGKSAEARDAYSLLSRRYANSPQAGDALMRAADGARDDGHFDDAARFYSQVVDQKGDPATVARARLGLAQSLAQAGKTDPALRVLQELIASKPAPDVLVRAHFAAGEAQEKANRPDEAVKAYQAALALSPRPEVTAACLLRVGALESQLKQYGPSASALNRLLSQYPKSSLVPEALYEMGWAFLQQQQTAKARPYFERLITEFGSHELAADAAFRVAEADFSAGQYAKAAGRYRLAAAAPSGKDLADKAWYKLGWCYREMKQYSQAADAFMKVPAEFPHSDLAPESRLRAGEALLAEDRPKEALVEFTRLIEALRGGKDSAGLAPRAQMGAANCRLKLGDADSGIAILRQVAVTGNGPLGAEAQARIADSFFERGQYQGALDEYLRVTMLFHSTEQAPYAQFRIGETYLKLGNAAAANSAFQKVIDGWGKSPWAEKARQRLNGGRAQAPAGSHRSATRPHRLVILALRPEPGARTVIPPPPAASPGSGLLRSGPSARSVLALMHHSHAAAGRTGAPRGPRRFTVKRPGPAASHPRSKPGVRAIDRVASVSRPVGGAN